MPSSSCTVSGCTPDSERLKRTRFSHVLCQRSSSNGTKRKAHLLTALSAFSCQPSASGCLPAVPANNVARDRPDASGRRAPTARRRSSPPRRGRTRCRGGFFFQAEDGIRDYKVTGVQTCALPISRGLITWSPLALFPFRFVLGSPAETG